MIPVLLGLAVSATSGIISGAVAAAVVDEIKESRQQKALPNVEKKIVSEEYVLSRARKNGRKIRKVVD